MRPGFRACRGLPQSPWPGQAPAQPVAAGRGAGMDVPNGRWAWETPVQCSRKLPGKAGICGEPRRASCGSPGLRSLWPCRVLAPPRPNVQPGSQHGVSCLAMNVRRELEGSWRARRWAPPVVGSSRANPRTHSGHSGDPSRLHCSLWNGGWRGPRELWEAERNAGPHAHLGLPKIQPENTPLQSDGVGSGGLWE